MSFHRRFSGVYEDVKTIKGDFFEDFALHTSIYCVGATTGFYGSYQKNYGTNSQVGEHSSEDVIYGSNTKSEQKLNNQINNRGWTYEEIEETIDSPRIIYM